MREHRARRRAARSVTDQGPQKLASQTKVCPSPAPTALIDGALATAPKSVCHESTSVLDPAPDLRGDAAPNDLGPRRAFDEVEALLASVRQKRSCLPRAGAS